MYEGRKTESEGKMQVRGYLVDLLVERYGNFYFLASIFSMKCEARSLAESEGNGGSIAHIQIEDVKCSFWRVGVSGWPRSIEL